MNLQQKTQSFFSVTTRTDIQSLRESLLLQLLFNSATVGAVLFILALFPVLKAHDYKVIVVYLFFEGLLLMITFLPNLSHNVRLIGFLFFIFSFGIINLLFSGLNVDAGLFFITFITMTVLFLDVHRALTALVLSLVSIAIAGTWYIQKSWDFQVGLLQTDPQLWLVGGAALGVMAILLTISINSLLRGLTDNIEKVKQAAAAIELKNKTIAERELHYRSLFDTSPNIIMRFDLDWNIENINLAGEKLLKVTQADVVGKSMRLLLADEYDTRADEIIETITRYGELHDNIIAIRGRDNRVFWMEFSAAKILDADGQAVGVIGVGKDITQRRRAEALVERQTERLRVSEKRLRGLTRQLISAQEDERRKIARELHDDVGQSLITLKHSLIGFQEAGNAGDMVCITPRQWESLLSQVDRAIGGIRSAAHQLRPPALEAGGLDVALEDLCERMKSASRIDIRFAGQEIPALDDGVAISLYRFAQEALSNVLKHAAATEVNVSLSRSDGELILDVRDNGVGQTPTTAELTSDSYGIGLLGMRERMALLSGRVDVETDVMSGYSIRAVVPFSPTTA